MQEGEEEREPERVESFSRSEIGSPACMELQRCRAVFVVDRRPLRRIALEDFRVVSLTDRAQDTTSKFRSIRRRVNPCSLASAPAGVSAKEQRQQVAAADDPTLQGAGRLAAGRTIADDQQRFSLIDSSSRRATKNKLQKLSLSGSRVLCFAPITLKENCVCLKPCVADLTGGVSTSSEYCEGVREGLA